jgi:hypothetical protein
MAEFKLGRLRFVWKNTWSSSATYVKDDIVRYGGMAFVCVLGHEADNDFNVDLLASRWQKMSVGQEWKTSPWTAEALYKEGDIVKYGGNIYISVENHTANSTQNGGFYTDKTSNGYWNLLVDGKEWKGPWTTSTYYKLNDTVKYNGLTYICNTPHTSASTASAGREADNGKWDLFGEGFKWRGTWDKDVAVRYIVNDLVKYGANVWICSTYHTSGASFDESKWQLFVPGLEFEDSWSSSALYQEGDIVTYGGYSYISKQLHTNAIPSTNSAQWSLLTTGYNTRGRYNGNQSYRVGDVVNYGGSIYVSIADSTSNQTPFSNPLNWSLVSPGIRWLGDWSAPTTEGAYKIGDAVVYMSTSYICIDEHTPVDEGGLGIPTRPDLDTEGTWWTTLAEGAATNVMTRRGDLVTRNAIQNTRLAKGNNGEFLKAGETDLSWSKVGNITRVFYVSVDGIDDPDRGTTLSDPWRTVKYACDHVRTQVVPTYDLPAVIMVKTGVYTEEFPISIPKFTSLVGDELRMSIVQPTAATSHLDKFYMRDSTTVRNFTLRGATGDPVLGDFTEENQYQTRRPTGGPWMSLDPGTGPNDESVWVGARSPYIQNVTTFGTACVGQKIDGALHNGGNKSITSNDFTQVMSDSIGAWCTNQGRAELVSVFTYYSYIGYLCENGGVIRATNGNNSYGTYGSVSEGVDPTEISRTAEVDNRRLDAIVDRVQTNGASLLYVEYLNAGETYTSASYDFTGPGTATLLANATFNSGGVTEVRVLDDGSGYLSVTNNSQQGTDYNIRLSASDTAVTSAYDGMRITLIDGAGVGQYAVVNKFDGGSKDLYVLKESFTPLTVYTTNAATDNKVGVSSTSTLAVDQPVMFMGTMIGGLSASTLYYVKALVTGGFTLYTNTSTKALVTLTSAVASSSLIVHRVGWDTHVADSTKSITAITKTNPVRVTTSGNHGFVDGFTVTFAGVGGMTQLNGNTYYVVRYSNTQFDLYTSYTLLTSVDGTGYTTYTSAGTVVGRLTPAPYLDTTTRYIIEPRPVFSTGSGASGTPVRTLGINTVSVSSGGKGFHLPPTVKLSGPDTVIGNSSATGVVTINGTVDSVVVQSKGTGFTSAPTLAFVGGGLPSSYTLWASEITVVLGEYIRTSANRIYEVTVAGVLSTSAPTHTSSTATNGTATLLYLGRVASATANTTRTIKTVNLADGGSGFSSPPSVLVTGTGGSGAVITAQISQVIGSIVVDTNGANYTSPPTVTLTGGEPLIFAQAEAVLSAEVTDVVILEGGTGYNPTTTTVSLNGGGGVGALAHAVIDFGLWEAGNTPGVITSIIVDDPGSGYSTPPVVVIEGDGLDASAETLILGTVESILLTNKGRGYVSTPLVVLTGGGATAQATAHAVRTGSVKSLTVADGGISWVGTPTLSFTGGGGTGASATVTAMDTVINTVTVDDAGANYTSNPALAVSGGGGSGAILRPRINGIVTAVTITDPGSDYSSTPVISFVGGGNYRTSVAGQRYYANASAAVAIGASQIDATLDAITRLGVVAKAVVANTDPSSFQASIIRTAGGGGYSKPANIDQAIDIWINTVYFTIENDKNQTIAANLLRLNRRFIKTEVKAWIDLNYGGLSNATWTRDIGLIVDAVANDIADRGVDNTLACGISQAFLTARSDPSSIVAIDAAVDYMIDMFKDLAQNIVFTPTLDAPLNFRGAWATSVAYAANDVVVTNGATYTCQTSHTSNALFATDLSLSRWAVKADGQVTNDSVFESNSLIAIENCLTLMKQLFDKAPGSAGFATAATLIQTNKAYIKAEVLGKINTDYTDFDYNEVLCARDVGFIIDAMTYDLVNAKVTSEPVASSTTTGVISSITVDAGGEGYSEGVTITLGAGTSTVLATARPVIDSLTGAITSFTMTNKGKGYTTAPSVTITPDTGSGVVARCRLAGTNVSRITIIKPGSGYTSGPFMKLIDPNNGEEASFSVRVASGVLGQPTWENRGTGWLTADGSVSGDGYADVRQTGSYIYVKALTNVPTPGANIQFAGNSEYYKLVTVRETVGPEGLIGARQLLLANKTFIQEEIISYLNNFTYNTVTCERDIGYILDALGEDVVYGSNYQILASLQQYRRGTYTAFANQKFQTAFALNYLKGLIGQSQKPATLASMAELRTLIAAELVSNSTAVSRANANATTIISILNTGLSAVPAIVTPDPTGFNVGYSNARRLLLLNREFLIAEVTGYIQDQIDAGTAGFVGLVYSSANCERDVGYVIDALQYDLTYGGNLMSLLAGTSYYSYTQLQVDANDKVATLAAYQYLRNILSNVLQGTVVASPAQVVVAQNRTGTGGSSAAAAFAQDRVGDIRTTINTGTAPATINPDTAWVNAGILTARSTLIANKSTIQSDIIAFIEENYPTIVFNRDTCSRDIGYIIDAIGWDVAFGSNFQSIKSGMAYYRAGASAVLTGLNGVTSLIAPLIEWIKNEEVFKDLPDFFMPDGPANTEENHGKDILISNRNFIGVEAYNYFIAQHPSLTSSINQTLFRQEIEQIAMAVAHDLTYNGNQAIIDFASSFYSGATLRIPGYSGTGSTIKTEYLDLIDFLNASLQTIVQNGVITRQTATVSAGLTQDRSLTPGDAGTGVFVNNLMTDFKAIINLTTGTIGITVTSSSNDYTGYSEALLSAQTSLEDSKANLKSAVSDWMDAQWVNFTYNRAYCYRDVGLIVSGIADDLFGDVAKSVEAGQRYYSATAAVVLEEQMPQTIAAVDRINTIAQKVIRNETYTRTQNNAFQERFPSITGGGDAGNTIIDRTLIIRRIIENGETLNFVKQTLLDNKEYLKAEVIAYINASYESLDYDQLLCARDVGLIVDAICYDIFGGFSRSREAGLRYYSSASALIAITTQYDPTTDALRHLRDLMQSVILNQAPSVTFQEIIPRVGAGYDTDNVPLLNIDIKITDCFDELLAVIDNGPSALPAGLYTARLQISPPITVFNSPLHETATTTRSKYSQVRLTGHDFLNIGTGNKSDTNYPGLPVNLPDQTAEIVETGGGRCFYTSTDQDGNFRVGELFRVEQSTGIATLNADAFNLSGLNELSLGGITLGGTNATIREFSTDATFFANSDNIVPTQKAIKTYIQSALGSGGGNIAVNAVIAGQTFLSGDELTTIGNIPMRFTSTGGYQVESNVNSTSSSTGSLRVTGTGGIGVAGNVYTGGVIQSATTITAIGGLNSTAVGNVTRSTGAFTTVTANDLLTLTKATGTHTISSVTASTTSAEGALVISGGLGVGGNLNVAGSFNVGSLSASGIDNTPIGSSTRSTGAFTTLAANAQVTFSGNIASSGTGSGTVVITGGLGVSAAVNIGTNLTASGTNGQVTFSPTGTGGVTISPTGSGGLTINPTTTGTINNASIGASTRSTGAFTTLAANSTVSFSVATGTHTISSNTASSTTGTGALTITGGLGVGGQVTAATLVETSSIVFKQNVNPIADALDSVLQLVGVTYDRKDGSRINEAGLIAEDVNKVLPDLVSKDENGNAYGIQYTKLTAYLIEAVKTLKQEIDQLKGNK